MATWRMLAETAIVWRRRANLRRRLRRQIIETLSGGAGHRRFVSPRQLIREAAKPFWRA